MTLVDDLLAGPRGRRLLLEFSLASEEIAAPSPEPRPLITAVANAAFQLVAPEERPEVQAWTASGWSRISQNRDYVSPEEVAGHLASVPLTEAAPQLLRLMLQRSVDAAMYWQAPWGEDRLAGIEPVREQLRRIAEHVAAAPSIGWWSQGVDPDGQWAVTREEDAAHDDVNDVPPLSESLEVWRDELRARQAELAVTGEVYNGAWWSVPPYPARVTTRELEDGTPAGLHFTEDRFGDTILWALQATLPDNPRVFEIAGPEDWAQLCRDHPLEVTGQMRNQWGLTTGRLDGKWVIPDFAEVARHHDALHLTARGYLSTGGRVVEVDGEYASVLAGWDVDETYWLTDEVSLSTVPVTWSLGQEDRWQRREGEEAEQTIWR